MAPSKKGKAAGVSASSFLDLKAEIAKQEEQFAKNKAAGKATAIVGGVKRPDKKPSVWAKQNAGVNARAARDVELEEISRPTLDSARAALERKAKVYDKLRRGKSGWLNEKQYDALLVDFDQKAIDAYESDSDDEDESLTVPQPPLREEDDPIVEYEDEFGRMRTARKSEVPRHLLEPQNAEPEAEFDPDIVYNPVNHFPVYEPSAERVAAIESEFSEENNPLNMHYDAAGEVRAKGAGFYQFSGDEETRRQQMEELRRAREETERTRETTGAADVRPGEVEGMQAPGEGSRSRAVEKRKRELEERRRMLDAKRRKVAGSAAAAPAEPSTPTPSTEKTSVSPVDPFAALEAQAAKPLSADRKGKMKERPTETPLDVADAFLAQLEQDVLQGVQRK